MKPKHLINEEKLIHHKLALAVLVFGLQYIEDMAKTSGVNFFEKSHIIIT